jgi:outer membrane lipoprotein-sorting protein
MTMNLERAWHTRLPWGAVLALVFGVQGLCAQNLPSIQDVVDYIDDLYRAQSSHAIMTMTVTRERGTRELTLESWSRGDDEALIVIREPAREAGTATLRTKEGLWNYAPRADRLIRIPAGLLSDSWMGSHFTNDDLLRETSYLEDHDGTVKWVERDGEQLLEVTLIPKPNVPVVYTKLVFLIVPNQWTPRRADYYDGEKLIRSMLFDRIQIVAERPIPMRMVLQPADKPDERTEVLYDKLQLNVPVDADLFTRRGLRRVAQE